MLRSTWTSRQVVSAAVAASAAAASSSSVAAQQQQQQQQLISPGVAKNSVHYRVACKSTKHYPVVRSKKIEALLPLIHNDDVIIRGDVDTGIEFYAWPSVQRWEILQALSYTRFFNTQRKILSCHALFGRARGDDTPMDIAIDLDHKFKHSRIPKEFKSNYRLYMDSLLGETLESVQMQVMALGESLESIAILHCNRAVTPTGQDAFFESAQRDPSVAYKMSFHIHARLRGTAFRSVLDHAKFLRAVRQQMGTGLPDEEKNDRQSVLDELGAGTMRLFDEVKRDQSRHRVANFTDYGPRTKKALESMQNSWGYVAPAEEGDGEAEGHQQQEGGFRIVSKYHDLFDHSLITRSRISLTAGRFANVPTVEDTNSSSSSSSGSWSGKLVSLAEDPSDLVLRDIERLIELATPDVADPFREWLRAGIAFKNMSKSFPWKDHSDDEREEKFFELFDKFSQRSSRKYDPDGVRDMWPKIRLYNKPWKTSFVSFYTLIRDQKVMQEKQELPAKKLKDVAVSMSRWSPYFPDEK